MFLRNHWVQAGAMQATRLVACEPILGDKEDAAPVSIS